MQQLAKQEAAPNISKQKVAEEDDELEELGFKCRKYREGEVIRKVHIEKWAQSLELTAKTIKTVRARFYDEIKQVVGLYPDEWKDTQRSTVR